MDRNAYRAKAIASQMRTMDWVQRHRLFRHLQLNCTDYMMEALRKQLSPDELLEGKNSGLMASPDDVFILPNAKRVRMAQPTLYNYFFVKKRRTYQANLHRYFN